MKTIINLISIYSMFLFAGMGVAWFCASVIHTSMLTSFIILLVVIIPMALKTGRVIGLRGNNEND